MRATFGVRSGGAPLSRFHGVHRLWSHLHQLSRGGGGEGCRWGEPGPAAQLAWLLPLQPGSIAPGLPRSCSLITGWEDSACGLRWGRGGSVGPPWSRGAGREVNGRAGSTHAEKKDGLCRDETSTGQERPRTPQHPLPPLLGLGSNSHTEPRSPTSQSCSGASRTTGHLHRSSHMRGDAHTQLLESPARGGITPTMGS